MNRTLLIKSIALMVFVAFAMAATVFAFRPQFTGIRKGKADENYSKSEKCPTYHETISGTDYFSGFNRRTALSFCGIAAVALSTVRKRVR